jgi:hypothetical protein
MHVFKSDVRIGTALFKQVLFQLQFGDTLVDNV